MITRGVMRMKERTAETMKIFKVKKTGKGWWITCRGIIAAEVEEAFAKKVMRALNAVIRENFAPRKRISPGGARNKGLTFERELAVRLRPWFPRAKRHLEFQIDEARGIDLAHTGPYRFQCKKMRGYASVNTISEIKCDREILGDIPVLVTAADNLPAMVVMHLADFIAMLGKPVSPK